MALAGTSGVKKRCPRGAPDATTRKIMDLNKLAQRIHKHRGKLREIAEEAGMKYSTLRKLAGGHLPNARPATIEPIVEWLRLHK